MTITHLVQKQNIELFFTSDQSVENVWEDFVDFHKDEAHPLMNGLFDEIAGEENWVHIPKLEIDLGVISISSFKQQYLHQLRQTLEKSLQQQMMKEKVISKDGISAWEFNIIYYLKHGFFFWETIAHSAKKAESIGVKSILEKKILELMSVSASFIRSFLQCISEDRIALQRWVRQFSPGFRMQVKGILIKNRSSGVPELVVNGCKLMDVVMEKRKHASASWNERTQFSIWLVLFSDSFQMAQHYLKEWILDQLPVNKFQQTIITIFKEGNDNIQQELINYFLHNYSLLVNKPEKESFSYHRDEISASLNAWFKSKNVAVEKIENIISLPGKVSDVVNVPLSETHACENKNENGTTTDPAEIFTRNKRQDFEKMFKENGPVVTEGETIYVDNAGLVLIHPFIENYFTNTGIDTREDLADDKDASVCIQLIQLAASGEWMWKRIDLH